MVRGETEPASKGRAMADLTDQVKSPLAKLTQQLSRIEAVV